MGKQKAILVAALLAALPCLCFWEVFRGDLLLPTDWLHQDLEPWRQITPEHPVVNTRIKDAILDGYALDVISARAAREGRVALWNPYAGGGMPHLAAGFSRMLYPPFWIYAILDTEIAHNVEILMHLFLVEIFAFLFLRRLGATLTGSVLGALLYGFVPSITHRAEISFILPSLVWFPLLLTLVEDLVSTGRIRSFVGLAAVAAFQILAGHYPDIYINFLGAAVYGVVRLAGLRRPTFILWRGLAGAGAVALGAALAAPFLLPSLELIGRANRPVVSAAELSATGLGLDLVLTLFSPSIDRSQLYIGLLPLLFIPAAFRRVPRGPVIALLASFVVGVGIATGSPLFRFFYALVPGVEQLRYLGTHVALANFSLALLAGVGISQVIGTASPGMKRERIFGWVLLGLGTIATPAAWFVERPDLLSAFRLPGALGLLLVALLALELWVRQKIGTQRFAVLAGILIAFDLFSYARAFNPRVDADDYPPFPDFPVIEFLRSDPDTFRVATLLANYHSPFWPNTLGAYEIQDVGAYHSLLPRNLGSYMKRIRLYAGGATGEELLAEQDPSNNWIWLSSFRPTNLLRIWNIKYFILPAGWPNPDPAYLELVYDDEVRVFLYGAWLPRVWLAEQAIVLPQEQGIYARLLDPQMSPERTVLLPTEPSCYFPRSTGAAAKWSDSGDFAGARIVDYRAESMRIETRSALPSYLVISESFDPGWHARVDGEEMTLLEANFYFRALPLPAGAHEVELLYRPASYVWGWRLCGLALSVVLLAAMLARTRLQEGATTCIVVAATAAAIGAALLGWSHSREVSDPLECGQLHVARRLLGGSGGSFTRLGPLGAPAVTAPVPSEIPLAPTSTLAAVLRVFAAASASREDSADLQARVSTLLPGPPPGPHALTLAELNPRRREERWISLEIPFPRETETLLLQASSPRGMGSILWGNPLVLEPRARRPSRVCFVIPHEGSESLPTDPEPTLLKILLTMRDRAAPNGFDEVHFASDEADFSTRMLALAPTLYRRATFLVLEPIPERVAERQGDLLNRELERLGLNATDVVVDTCARQELTG
ncbi:MAG: YfhO family protein [Vicinamibacteria bacterium]